MKKRKKNSNITKPFKFVSKWRSLPLYELISYVFVFSSVPMLAYGINSYNWNMIKIIIFSVLSLYSGFFAVLIWNDISDAGIDAISHPDRPIPSGKISKIKFFGVALVFSATTFLFAFLVSIWCLIITGIAALFVTVHNKFLKKHVKIPAYSEILTPFQWIVVGIFGYFAIWTAIPQISSLKLYIPILGDLFLNHTEIQNLIILLAFIYFADSAHDISEGIADAEGDRKNSVKTYTTSFGGKKASIMSFLWFILSGLFGILLFINTILSPIFISLFLITWLYFVRYPYRLICSKEDDMEKLSVIVGRKIFDYFLICFNLIFIDIIIQLVLKNLSF